jgi:Protein of unknown function (DUF1569)
VTLIIGPFNGFLILLLDPAITALSAGNPCILKLAKPIPATCSMEVDQMLHHLNLACGNSLGFYNLPDESYLISRTVFRWILVDWFPEQPVGLRLPAGFKIPHSQRFEFAYEKAQLLTILEADWNARTVDAWKPHPMFGKMTPKEWDKLLQIHVDYHLRQFVA